MDCKVTGFEKREAANGGMPYYVLRARGSEGDENASVVDEDGFINPLAVQSRVFNFTKSLFPSTEAQCGQLESLYQVDEEGKVIGNTKIRLMMYQYPTPKPFNIVNKTGEFYATETEVETEKTADRQMTVNGKLIQKGAKYTTTEVVSTPKVFTQVTLILYCDKAGNSAEGNPEEIAVRNWKKGLESGAYILID